MKEQTQKKILIELLKKDWLSNYKIDQILRSASGQRRLREIRKDPPDGYVLTEMWIEKIERETDTIPWHKVFMLGRTMEQEKLLWA